jgi:ketosteroid isomerase-like protein
MSVGSTSVAAADSEFAALSRRTTMGRAFATYAAEDGVLLPGGDQPVYGREAITTFFADRPRGFTIVLDWSPRIADVAATGDLGFTVGDATSDVTQPDGRTDKRYSKYVTVWKKQANGDWKFAADCGNARPGP